MRSALKRLCQTEDAPTSAPRSPDLSLRSRPGAAAPPIMSKNTVSRGECAASDGRMTAEQAKTGLQDSRQTAPGQAELPPGQGGSPPPPMWLTVDRLRAGTPLAAAGAVLGPSRMCPQGSRPAQIPHRCQGQSEIAPRWACQSDLPGPVGIMEAWAQGFTALRRPA